MRILLWISVFVVVSLISLAVGCGKGNHARFFARAIAAIAGNDARFRGWRFIPAMV